MDEQGVFHIHGNAEGLRYLSEIAVAIIGHPPGPNHHVLGPGFSTEPDDDSPLFMVCYDPELEREAVSPPADPAP